MVWKARSSFMLQYGFQDSVKGMLLHRVNFWKYFWMRLSPSSSAASQRCCICSLPFSKLAEKTLDDMVVKQDQDRVDDGCPVKNVSGWKRGKYFAFFIFELIFGRVLSIVPPSSIPRCLTVTGVIPFCCRLCISSGAVLIPRAVADVEATYSSKSIILSRSPGEDQAALWPYALEFQQ